MRHGILLSLAITGFSQRHFPFLRLPGEIRDKIYRLIARERFGGFGPGLHEQPAITRGSRQLRAEALPVYLKRPINLELESPEIPCDWVKSVKEVIDLYGGKSGSPASGTLRHVTGVHLSFEATGKAWSRLHRRVRQSSLDADFFPLSELNAPML